ncbi:MAG: Rpn family recombination-promoting nuclease/putative transposase, partial [Clostridiales bacterium]
MNIEIQVAVSKYMPERSLYYWSKMYSSQIKKNDSHSSLKKCIAINILDYKFLPINQVHTQFHLIEDNTGYKITNVIELHFIELKKLDNLENLKDKN